MRYLYRNAAGQEREVEAPMSKAPPDVVFFAIERDDWVAGDTIDEMQKKKGDKFYDTTWTRFTRVYATPPVVHVKRKKPVMTARHNGGRD